MSYDEQKEAIIILLKSIDDYVPTIELARALFGPTATRKEINPILYRMEKDGLIKKRCEENGGKPEWMAK